MSTRSAIADMPAEKRVTIFLSQIGSYADPGQTIRVRVGGKVLALEIGEALPPLDDEFLAKAEQVMKACQRGVGGRDALEQAHSIMADCYGLLGRFLVHAQGYAG